MRCTNYYLSNLLTYLSPQQRVNCNSTRLRLQYTTVLGRCERRMNTNHQDRLTRLVRSVDNSTSSPDIVNAALRGRRQVDRSVALMPRDITQLTSDSAAVDVWDQLSTALLGYRPQPLRPTATSTQFALPSQTGRLTDRNFMQRMLYLNSYQTYSDSIIPVMFIVLCSHFCTRAAFCQPF